jgi:hippurate hydrolase
MNSPVEAIRRYHAELKELRHDLHAHPELAFEESRTAALVAEKLARWGVEVHRGLAKTGVVGVVRGRRTASGRGVALRADMDCLPMQEESSLAYRSRHEGRMHACGHDGTRRCSSAPRAISPRRAISTAPRSSSSSRPRKAAAARSAW